MIYISQNNGAIYTGDKAHWQDIPVTSERPSNNHVPVIENNEHIGWELSEELVQKERENTVVSAFQALAALDHFGYLDQIETMMADPETPKVTKLAWEKAQEFRRMSPTVLQIASVLGLTDEQLDELFQYAATVEA